MIILLNKYKEEIILLYVFSLLFLWDVNFSGINFKFFLYPLLIIFFFLNFKDYSFILLAKIALITLFILLHSLFFVEGEILYLKNIYEVFLIFFLYFFCFTYYEIFLKNIDTIIKIFIIFFISSIFISTASNLFIGIEFNLAKICSFQFDLLSEKYLFSEKSHLGMISVGVASYLLYTFNRIRTIYYKTIIGIFLILLFLNSSTLFLLSFVISNFIIFIFNFKNFNKNSISILIFSILFLITLSHSPSCSIRFVDAVKTLNVLKFAHELNVLKLANDETNSGIYQKKKAKTKLKKEISKNFSNNFTTQVHIKALLILKESIINNPFGIGFNNYFIAHKKYKNKVTTINPDVNNVNVHDGTNNFIKLLTEFGFLSLFDIMFIILFTDSSFLKSSING